MNKRALLRKIQNARFIILLFGVCSLILLILTPLHELFHTIPCAMFGHKPIMAYSTTICQGMYALPEIQQFIITMGPYLAFILTITLGLFLIKRYKAVKYALLLPVMEIIENYFSNKISIPATLNNNIFNVNNNPSDFQLINSMSPEYVIISKLFVIIAILATYIIIRNKTFEYKTYKKDKMPLWQTCIFKSKKSSILSLKNF